MRQSWAHGPSRNARSRSESGSGTKPVIRSQRGAPENSSASHQTVPASSAIRSVSLIRGRSGVSLRSAARVITARRTAGAPVAIAIAIHTASAAIRPPPPP